MTVFALFENDSDGYTYSSEELLGVFESKEEAEQVILERVALGEWYDEEREKHIKARHALLLADDYEGVKRLHAQWALELTNRGLDPRYPSPGKRDVGSYEIEELTVGKLRG